MNSLPPRGIDEMVMLRLSVWFIWRNKKHAAINPFSTVSNLQSKLIRLRDIERRRFAQLMRSSYRMESTCELISDKSWDNHGHYQICYQRFFASIYIVWTLNQLIPKCQQLPGPVAINRRELVIYSSQNVSSEGRRKIKAVLVIVMTEAILEVGVVGVEVISR